MDLALSNIDNQPMDISPVDALWTLIQRQSKSVRRILAERLRAEEEAETLKKSQRLMVKESLTKAFDELHSGKIKHNARDLFVQ